MVSPSSSAKLTVLTLACLLAVPFAPASAQSSPPTTQAAHGGDGVAGWYGKDGFAIKSRDGDFRLRIGMTAAYRVEPYWKDGKQQNRRTITILRPVIEGHIFRKWIRFWTSLELSQNPPFVVDSYIEIQPWSEFGLRIGQQFTPLSRHEYFGAYQLMFPDWASVADYFWTGRDKGITALGSVLGGRLDYYAGVYSGTPLRQYTALNGSWVVIGRLTVNPQGPVASDEVPYITSEQRVPRRASFTLQGAAGNYALATENFNPSSFRFDTTPTGEVSKRQIASADLWLQGPRFAFLAEAYLRRTTGSPDFHSAGAWAQLGVGIWNRMLDVSARASWFDASNRLRSDRAYALEAQLGYYPFQTQSVMGKLRYGLAKQQTPGAEALGTATLLFPAGWNHILTLQLMIAL